MLVVALVIVAVALVLMGWVVGHFGSRRNREAQATAASTTRTTETRQQGV